MPFLQKIFRPCPRHTVAHTFKKPTIEGANIYSGEAQSPTILNFYSEFMNKTGDVSETELGNYEIVVSLKDKVNCRWDDGTLDGSTDDITLSWSIVKKTLAVPVVTGTLTYNTSSQSPTLDGYDEDWMSKSGDTSKTTAGDYELVVSLDDTTHSEWMDGTTEDKTIEWSIEKAPAVKPTIDVNSLTLTEAEPSGDITVTKTGDGVVRATISQGSKAELTFPSTNVIRVTGTDFSEAAELTVTVHIAEGTNYLAYEEDDVVCAVAITV